MRHHHGAERKRRHGMHGHACQTPGCGITWYHDGDETAKLDHDAYVAAHTCRKCGQEERWHLDVPDDVRAIGNAIHELEALLEGAAK